MSKHAKVVGIVGSYRKHSTIDQAVTAVLDAAANQGAETKKIYLLDQQIEFCTNCRSCMQKPGWERGQCIWQDDMENLLQQIETADSLVIGAPVNCGNINALTQRFAERTVVYGYWPWGAPAPKMRRPHCSRQAVLISSSGAPGIIAKWYFKGVIKSLKALAARLGAKPVGTLWIGLVNTKQIQLSQHICRRAQRLGEKLAVPLKSREPRIQTQM